MKIGIAGLGLIGGSLALALREKHAITGFDTAPGARDAARRAGVGVSDTLEGLLPADAVVVATPLQAVLPTLAALGPVARDAVLMDVGSVRGPVDEFATKGGSGRIVGLHPMAGRTAQGFGAADRALFAGRPFLVVPTPRSDAHSMALAGEIARAAGGTVTVCSAAEHDRMVALLSALPLAIAAALSVVASDGLRDVAALAGPGYRDATRLASTSTELGTAMLSANSANVVAAIAKLRLMLGELERAVADQDANAIRAILERAASARAALS